MLNMLVVDAYLGLGEGWLALVLGMLFLSVVVGVAFLVVGIRRLVRATGLQKMWGLLLAVAGILLPIACFLGISSIL